MGTEAVIIQIILNGMMLGIQYALIAVGFTLFFGVLDIINFSHGDVFMLGAFIGLILINIFSKLEMMSGGASYVIVLFMIFFLCMLITGSIGIFFERITVKRVAAGPPLMALLATLGLAIAVREAVRLFYPLGSESKRFPELLDPIFANTKEAFEIGGVIIRYDNLLIFGIGVVVIIVVSLYINKTKMGLGIRAVAQDSEAAMMMGVNRDMVVDITFLIGSALAGLTGILNGLFYNSIIFDMGAMGAVIGFSAAVIGGLGNIYGAIIGGFVFAMTQALSAAFIPKGSEYMDVVAFGVLIIFLVFKPSGILGEKMHERV
jgi:branched-chain amino acid transport system permease protein